MGRILILDSKSTAHFRLPKEKELCYYGEYRTNLQIMEIYDRMRHAIDSRLSLKATYARPTRREHGNFLLLLDGQMILEEIGGHNTYFCVVGSSFLASTRRTIWRGR